jgi:predicted esterase
VSTEHHLSVPRSARYFAIGEPTPRADELWIVCHGYGQLAGPFIETFERIASPSRVIVAPEALSRFYLDPNRKPGDRNPAVGATWMTREDRDHEIADHVRYLDLLVDHLRASMAPGGVRLRVLGFSQGVATVVRWAMRSSTRADELILWAGGFPPDVDLPAFAARLGSAPLTMVGGTRDQLAPWAAAEEQIRRLSAAGIGVRSLTFDGGHRLDNDTVVKLASA